MNNKLKISSNYGTPYSKLKAIAKTKAYYDENEWRSISRGNTSYTIESYIDMLNKSDNVSLDYLNKEYNFQNSDGTTKLAALYNEVYANRNNVDVEREKYATDENNNVIMDENNEPVKEKYKASDYDYYKSLIKQQNNYNYEKWLVEQEQERKDSMNWFVRDVLGNIAGTGGEFVYGFTKQIDDVIDLLGATVQATDESIADGTNWADNFSKYITDDNFRMFDGLGESILDFESRYTSMRDLNGNYTTVGKYLGGVSNSLGQMAPEILLTIGLNVVGTALAGTTSTLSVGASTFSKLATTTGNAILKSAPIASQLMFYTGVTTSYIRDAYKQFALEGCTVPSEQIIANAVLKAGMQATIEIGLGKILGGSALDNLVFGRTAKSVTGKTLFTRSLKRLTTDFAQEGLEEVLQDTSDFMIDQGFSYVINNNFGKLSEDFSLQSLIDAFIIGGIASFAGNAGKIVFTNSKNIQGITNSDNIFVNKMSAWEYGLDMQSFIENYDKVIKLANADKNVKNDTKYVQAMTELYASYRIIASLYGEIGKERFEAANKVLTDITTAMKDGVFNKNTMKQYAKDLYESVLGKDNLNKAVYEAELQKIEDAKLAEEVASMLKGEDVEFTNIREDAELKSVMEEMIEQNSKVEKVIATKHGENVVMINGTVIAPIQYLKNARAMVANATIKEHELINDVIQNANDKYGLNLNNVLDTYKKLTGDKNADINKAITALLLDRDLYLFRTMLVTANKDTYSFLSGLTNHINMISMTDVADKIHKNTLVKIRNRMVNAIVDYLKVQPNADYQLPFLSKSQINSIKIERWANNVYTRVILGENLSERDMNVLISRINNMTLRDDVKKELVKDIQSVNADVRESAMKRIDGYYNNMYTTKYDGKTYMPMNSVPNMAFNKYLQNNGLTLETWLSTNITPELSNLITTMYGKVDADTIKKYRVKMFNKFVNKAYSIEIKNGKINIVNTDDGTTVGYSNYNSKINDIISGSDVGAERNVLTNVNNTKKLISITKSLLDENINDTVANMVSINDIIYDTDLLNEKIKDEILTKYGSITPENTFMHLRDLLISTYKTISLVAKPDGSFAFVDVKPMLNMFKSKELKIGKNTKLSDIVKSEYLKGILTTTEIEVVNENIAAEYVMYENVKVQGKLRRTLKNTIYIGKNTAKANPEYLKFAIAHEIQHVIQFENKLNLGLNENWLSNVSKGVKNKIVSDVKKHKPDLFKEGMTEEQIDKAVSSFIYHTSGESAAMGLDTTELVDFYPTIVSYTDNSTIITLPWGNTYDLKQGLVSHPVKLSLTNEELQENPEVLEDIKKRATRTALKTLADRYEDTDYSAIRENDEYIVTDDYFEHVIVRGKITDYINNLDNVFFENKEDREFFKKQYNSNISHYTNNKRWDTLYKDYINDKSITDKLTRLNVSKYNNYSVEDIRNLFNDLNSDDDLKLLADKVFITFDNIMLEMEDNTKLTPYPIQFDDISDIDNTGVVIGNYNYNARSLYYGLTYNIDYYKQIIVDKQDLASTILHEVIHACTSLAIQNTGYKIGLFTDEQMNNFDASSYVAPDDWTDLDKACLQLLQVFEQVKKDSAGFYGETDVYELVSELSNPIFRLYLQTKKLWQRIVDAIKNLFGIKHETLLDAADDALERILNNFNINDYEFDINMDFYDVIKKHGFSKLGPDEVRMSLAKNVNNETKSSEFVPRKKAKHKTKVTYDTDERYLKWKEAQGTNLEYFYKKGKKTQLHPELKKFIALTTDIPVDEKLMEKINGKKAGTLTYTELREYFAFTDLDNMDDDTFDVFNKAVFKNKAIKTKEDLQNYIDKSDKYFAAYLAYKKGEKSAKNLELLSTKDVNVSDSIVNVFENKLRATKLDTYGKLYNQLLQKYDENIVPDHRYLKILWMRYFDGSLDSASHAVNIARWVEKYDKATSTRDTTTSMSTEDAAERTVGDKIQDSSALEAFDAVLDEMSAKEKREMLSLELTKTIATSIVNKYGTSEEVRKTTMSTLMKAKEILAKLPNKELNSLAIQKIVSEVLGTDLNKIILDDKINDFVNKEVPVGGVIRGIKNRVRNISRRLNTKWQKTKFLEKYGDYFNEDLTLKEELYIEKNGTYKSNSEISKLKETIEEASELVKSGVFTSSQNFRAFEQLQREMRKNIQQLKDMQAELEKKTNVKTIKVLNINDYKIDVESTRDIPDALKEILNTEFKEIEKSKTKYLTNDSDAHFRTNFKQFIDNNATKLASLTQDDVDEIVKYYSNSRTLETNVTGRLYNAIQLYMSTYLLKIDSINNFILTESQRDTLTKTTEALISTAAQELSNWKSAMSYLKPAQDICNSLAQSCGIEIDEKDIDNLIKAISTGKPEQIDIAKKQMIENTTKKYRLQGRKINILDRLLQFQRVSMLSSPSTWGRNITSNISITGLNALSGSIGKLLDVSLSKKQKQKFENQYKIVGTKVDKNTSDFVKRTLLDNKLFDSINDTLSKYDPRSADKRTVEHNLAKMITKKIGTDIFYNNYLDEKVSKFGKFGKFTKRNINGWYKFVYKALSDDVFVKKATLKYFSKMLVEDNVDLSKGLTNEIQSILADAYVLAASDYMHKSNLITKLEGTIKKHSQLAYFIYKQVFPFAGASWNWFMEGINYTPVGLLSNIVKFAKLENTIEKLDKAREKGDTVPNSRFAKYIVSRNIGKGIIGSIGTMLGILLASLGLVRLDEEDDKYKLYCNGIYVDISDLFGTQGIFLGLSLTQGILDGYEDFTDDEGNINFDKMSSIIAQGFNVFFMDSIYADLWNTVRFNGDLGQYGTNLPFNMLQTYIPNWYKTMMSIFYPYDIQYSSGIQGKVERLGANIAPWAFPKQVDVYTGEYQLAYKGGPFVNDLINAYNKFAPIKIQPYNVTKNEEEAVLLGVHKGMLTGKYKIDDKEVKLTPNEVVMLNQYYGQLNKTELDLLYSDSTLYEVENDKGLRVKLRYSKMNDKQKTTVIKRIMSNNSSYAKVYILTNKGYLYYASESEFTILKKLGIENVYKKTKTKQGFIKP